MPEKPLACCPRLYVADDLRDVIKGEAGAATNESFNALRLVRTKEARYPKDGCLRLTCSYTFDDWAQNPGKALGFWR